MLFFLVYILFVIICPSTVANVLIYFSQVLMLPSYRTILVYGHDAKNSRMDFWIYVSDFRIFLFPFQFSCHLCRVILRRDFCQKGT